MLLDLDAINQSIELLARDRLGGWFREGPA